MRPTATSTNICGVSTNATRRGFFFATHGRELVRSAGQFADNLADAPDSTSRRAPIGLPAFIAQHAAVC